jgi:SAM-dependent methyltransferase
MICSICGSQYFMPLYKLPSGEIVRCEKCRTVCRSDMIAGDDAVRLYDEDSYLNSPYFQALRFGKVLPPQTEPYQMYQRTLQKLENKVTERRLLDVGCSYGAFLEIARRRGWEVAGVEISKKSAAYARHERQLDVFNGTLEQANYADGRFPVVTLWDVIEHLDRPVDMLREILRILAPNGIVVIFTINQKSLMNQIGHAIYKFSFGKIISPAVLLYDIHHNYFFDPSTLLNLLGKAGLGEQTEIEWMDANIERWQAVPIPPTLAFGSKCVDALSHLVGMPYRMVVLARPGKVNAQA